MVVKLYKVNGIYLVNWLKLSILLAFLVSGLINVHSQISYYNDFDDATENSNWMMRVGAAASQISNRWWIGSPDVDADNLDTGNYLYMSCDSGATAGYDGTGGSLVVAYRKFNLTAGTYDLAFDWLSMGSREESTQIIDGSTTTVYGESNAKLYVVWYPESLASSTVVDSMMITRSSYTGDSNMPGWMKDHKLLLNGTDCYLYGRSSWINATAKVTVPADGEYRLTFVWVNENATANPPAACVDNVQLADEACAFPTDLTAISNNVKCVVSWSGSSTEYELKYSTQGDSVWTTVSGITTNTTTLYNVPIGVYEFRIRAICDSDTSIWVYYPMTLVYEADCIDYLDLSSAFCTYGSFYYPDAFEGVLDYGAESSLSSHTIHYDQNEYDPRTYNMFSSTPTTLKLKTVPEGFLASVRLGNWDNGAEAETITYDYYVDTDVASILLLNYAVVLQAPSHGDDENPRFTLDILDENGDMIDANCGSALFTGKVGMDGWNEYNPATTADNMMIVWKDWTTVGLNLEAYNGRNIKIKLATYDCSPGAHYGYAYFTLGCTAGHLEGINCGEEQTDSFAAPEGFIYKWYKKYDASQTTVSTDRVYYVENELDTATYCVDVIYPTYNGCYFTLEASSKKRFPLSDAVFKHTPTNCENIVTVYNNSCVTVDDLPTTESLETYEWDFGDGTILTTSDSVLTRTFPNSGGTLTLKLRTTIGYSPNECEDIKEFVFEVPAIEEKYDTITINKCEGDVVNTIDYIDTDTTLVEPGDYPFIFKSDFSGCDSTITLHVVDAPTYDIQISDQIKSGDSYQFGDKTLTDSGVYVDSLLSVNGCDSVVILDLVVTDVLDVYIDTLGQICHQDDSIAIPIMLSSGAIDTIAFRFSDKAKSVGFVDVLDDTFDFDLGLNSYVIAMPDNILPDVYSVDVEIGDAVGIFDTDKFFSITLDIRYDTCVLAQRWNDVLAVKNETYNCGGFIFSAYQWYENDVAIEDAEEPNLYKPEGLNVNSTYSILLTRADDQVAQFSCYFVPAQFTGDDGVDVSSINSTRTLFSPNESVEIESEESVFVRIWTVLGALVSDDLVPAGGGYIAAPTQTGIYIMEYVQNNELVGTSKIVVQ